MCLSGVAIGKNVAYERTVLKEVWDVPWSKLVRGHGSAEKWDLHGAAQAK